MTGARTRLVAVAEELSKFTFYLRSGARARSLGKKFSFGRISQIIRPNMVNIGLVYGFAGLLSRKSLDA